MQSQNNVKGILRQYISESYLVVSGLDDFQDNDSFLEMGLIDSTGVLELLQFIEEIFEIKVEDEEVVPDNLDSLDNLTVFIERKLANAGK